MATDVKPATESEKVLGAWVYAMVGELRGDPVAIAAMVAWHAWEFMQAHPEWVTALVKRLNDEDQAWEDVGAQYGLSRDEVERGRRAEYMQFVSTHPISA